jgi:hypothetical protein
MDPSHEYIQANEHLLTLLHEADQCAQRVVALWPMFDAAELAHQGQMGMLGQNESDSELLQRLRSNDRVDQKSAIYDINEKHYFSKVFYDSIKPLVFDRMARSIQVNALITIWHFSRFAKLDSDFQVKLAIEALESRDALFRTFAYKCLIRWQFDDIDSAAAVEMTTGRNFLYPLAFDVDFIRSYIR